MHNPMLYSVALFSNPPFSGWTYYDGGDDVPLRGLASDLSDVLIRTLV